MQLSSILFTLPFVFTWGFVLGPLGVLVSALGPSRQLLLEVWKCFSQETFLYQVEPHRMEGVPGGERPHGQKEEKAGV